ncbi:MAG: hypothetical protein WC748_01870 [Legionellales bacterium]|jgi:hypothetical protein
MNIGFKFKVIYQDVDFLKIHISAWNGEFGGSADVYVDVGRLEEIAEMIRGFPRNSSDHREVVLGSVDPKYAEDFVSMQFYCVDAAGRSYIRAKIERKILLADTRQSVTLVLPIEATAIDLFTEKLHQLGTNKKGIAQLLSSLYII